MRSKRLSFILLAFYLVFVGGSAYYNVIFPVRFFHHFFITLLAAWWYYRRLKTDGLPQTPLNMPLFAMVAVWGISAITSIDSRMAFEYLWFMLMHVTIFLVLIDLIQRGRQRLIMDAQFLLAALVVLITGLELASWYFGLGITPSTNIGWINVIGPGAWFPLELPRVSLAMNISTLLAGYTAPLITVTIGWALTARHPEFRRVLWMLTVGLIVVLVFTFSRGGILSLLAGLGSLTVMRLAQRKELTRFISPKVVLGFAVVGAALGIILFAISQTRSSGDIVRLDMYRSAAKMVSDYPVAGVGVGVYGRAYRDYRQSGLYTRDRLASAHNLYLNTAAETGGIGIIVGFWMLIAISQAWWRTWKKQNTSNRKLRVEATIAALLGAGVHSMVDVFTTTPVVSMLLVLLAYSITGHQTVLDERPKGSRFVAALGLVITLAYGVFFIQSDRAQIRYQNSLAQGEDSIEMAQEAARIDPYMKLYQLQIAYLLGLDAVEDSSPEKLTQAIHAYEHALTLEPTWDVGWINLAALKIHQGEMEQAVQHLETAFKINPVTTIQLQLGRVADLAQNRPGKDIIAYYRRGMDWVANSENRLPISYFWAQTPLRELSVKDYLAHIPHSRITWKYRIMAVYYPEVAARMVKENPATAEEFWIAGQNAFSLGNLETAQQFFTQAIEKDHNEGDYYVSRARATLQSDPDAAIRDLNIAELLGTKFEYPNAIRAQITSDPDLIEIYLKTALPPRLVPQEFTAVLYGGRPALFDLYPEMRAPGPGHAAMQPWYILAEQYRLNGLMEEADRVYEVILSYAPDEMEALEKLEFQSDRP